MEWTGRTRTPRHPARLVLVAAVSLALSSGCTVERDRETEDCIDERMDEGLSAQEAHEECMGD